MNIFRALILVKIIDDGIIFTALTQNWLSTIYSIFFKDSNSNIVTFMDLRHIFQQNLRFPLFHAVNWTYLMLDGNQDVFHLHQYYAAEMQPQRQHEH